MLCSCNDPIQNVGQWLDLMPLDFELVLQDVLEEYSAVEIIQSWICSEMALIINVSFFPHIIMQGSDIKALKSFYQSLIENLRLQQNGNLAVR